MMSHNHPASSDDVSTNDSVSLHESGGGVSNMDDLTSHVSTDSASLRKQDTHVYVTLLSAVSCSV